MSTPFLDFGTLESLDARQFQQRDPYPWVNPRGALHDAAYDRLQRQLPPLELFSGRFAEKRKFGQASHDRYALEYREGLSLGEDWQGFIDELRGARYLAFLRRMLGTRRLSLSFHWHYTPNGCSVSPHCDARRKLGSHIFYFNTADDWRPEWGGETLILDDGGRFPRDSAPAFEDFASAAPAQALGNHSLLFGRRGNSWHGVKAVSCPDETLRKVFIVVINRAGWLPRVLPRQAPARPAAVART